MPRDDFYPDELTRQRCMAACYDKERETRLRWYFGTIKPNRSGEEQTSRQHEVLLRRLQAACPRPSEELQRLREERRSQNVHLPSLVNSEGATSVGGPSEISESVTLPVIVERDMKEADPEIRKQIYSGTSREGLGRMGYLSARQNLNPESKYAHPILSSWEYGWRLGDSIKVEDLRNPEYGRSRIVADTFYRNSLNTLSHHL